MYILGSHLKTAIIAIHQLPQNEETLWLRLLGKGRVQKRAIQELESLSPNNPLRDKAVDLLLSLKTTLEINQNPNKEDRELLMSLSPIYLQRLAEAKQEGIQEGIQEGRQEGVMNERRIAIASLLQAKFGSLDAELNAIIPLLTALTPEEFSPLLIQLSRTELLARFKQQ
ncbi:hypothetical protein [Brunnivagina elsteri]|uniref:hypothetical protein n=1 Tax=Brunnivagina elsteri TaxID=1247191 RepID=UPI0026C7F907